MLSRLLKNLSHVWLMLWLVALPLVHVHPEVDHAHGAQHHRHGGLVHSVLSQDLACEFHHHASQRITSLQKTSSESLACEHTNTHRLNHEEIDFSLLSVSPEESSPTDEPPALLIASADSLNIAIHVKGLLRVSDHSPGLPFSVILHTCRPPPYYST